MTPAALLALLQAALTLMTLVNATPSLPQSVRDQAQHIAQQAIAEVTTSLASTSTSSSTMAVVSSALSQVQSQDVIVGTGETVTPGAVVSVLYTGKLSDGTVFDSSAAHNNVPLTFTLGGQGLISGFQIGVNGMKVGGERIITIPASLAYGSQEVKDPTGKVLIPAGSTLMFDIKVIGVGSSATSTGTSTTTTVQ